MRLLFIQAPRGDEALSEENKELVRAANAEIPRDIDTIFCSPLPQAMQTAEIINQDRGVEIKDRKELNENEGEPLAETKKRVMLFVSVVEERFADRNILVVAHDNTLRMMYDLFSEDGIERFDPASLHDFEIF